MTSPLSADSFAGRPWIRRAAFLILLALINVPVYRGALNRFFSGDQIHYFVEVNHNPGFTSGLGAWDYNVARTFAKGDELLFRPLTHALLALETQAFGYRYRAWNQVNLLLHLAVAFLLFELLWTLQPSRFAAVFALLFSVLTANFELIVWNHLGGYLLGYALMLVALRQAWILDQHADRERPGILAAYGAATLGAMGCHEIAVVGALLTAVWLLWSRKRRRIPVSGSLKLALLLPIGIYGLLYLVHVASCERWTWTRRGGGTPLPYLGILTSLGDWSGRALNPWYSEFSLGTWNRFRWSSHLEPNTLGVSFAAVALGLAALGLSLRAGLRREHLARVAPWAALLVGIILSYSALNHVGRPYAAEVTYYLYFFSMAASVLLYALVDFAALGRAGRTAALWLLLLLGAANASRTTGLSWKVAALNEPVTQYFQDVETFVALHRDEPGFAFAVDAPDSLDPLLLLTRGYPDHDWDDATTVTEMLYPRYYDASILERGPSSGEHEYLLKWRDGWIPMKEDSELPVKD